MSFPIYRANPSEGANNLRDNLGATMLRSQGSSFNFRPHKTLINWGSSGAEARRLFELFPAEFQQNFLNKPDAVAKAVNKLRCLQLLRTADVATVPFFTGYDEVLDAVGTGRARAYARTVLNGSSGEGIRLIMNREDPQANETANIEYPVDWVGNSAFDHTGTQLFTMGIMGRRNEWRVHVVNGTPILTQLKLRRGLDERPVGYTSLVRNLETGWIYSINFEQEQYPAMGAVQSLAIAAVEALGLDFGAVDVISRGEEVFVLEVNTAPGLADEGTAVQSYCDAFRNMVESRQTA